MKVCKNHTAADLTFFERFFLGAVMLWVIGRAACSLSVKSSAPAIPQSSVFVASSITWRKRKSRRPVKQKPKAKVDFE